MERLSSSTLLAPADRLRRSGPRVDVREPRSAVGSSVLSDFVRNSQSWGTVPVPLPARLRSALWIMIAIQVLWGIALVVIITGATTCDGLICNVATLHRHAPVLLACAVICVTGLAGLAPVTRGLSHSDSREVVGLGLAVTAGAVALLGIVALVGGALIVLIVVAAFVLGFSSVR